jgi:hypothetical protein
MNCYESAGRLTILGCNGRVDEVAGLGGIRRRSGVLVHYGSESYGGGWNECLNRKVNRREAGNGHPRELIVQDRRVRRDRPRARTSQHSIDIKIEEGVQ